MNINRQLLQSLLADAIAKRDALVRRAEQIEKKKAANYEAWISASSVVERLTSEIERLAEDSPAPEADGLLSSEVPLSALQFPHGAQSAIAARFGVTRAHVCRVASGERRSPPIEEALREEARNLMQKNSKLISEAAAVRGGVA